MILSRRSMLAASGAAIATAAGLAEARGLVTEPQFLKVIDAALSTAKRQGASYADVRIHRRRSQHVGVRDNHVSSVSENELYGVGVRVICQGAWGFASTSHVDPSEAGRAAVTACAMATANAAVLEHKVELAANPVHVAVWQTPLEQDPFKIPPADKAELLLAVSQKLRTVKGITFCNVGVSSNLEWKLFASSEGALIEQTITRLDPSYQATAIDKATGEVANREWDGAPAQAGWEYLEQAHFLEDAERVATDAIEKLKAGTLEPKKRDLILSPSNLYLTIHESVGHPTELDRALGMEANFAGTSFATLEKRNSLIYASPIVTVFADKTTPAALATCGYDDDGVKTQKWNLVEKGLFVGYQTTRDQAGWIGETASRGCSYAQDHASVPFQRMPNVSLAPGDKDIGVKDLIAGTEDGVYIVGNGSWSIDHQRYNFQFGGQMFYEVKKGKITRPLKDIAYQSNTPEFWRSCDAIGGAKSWELNGAFGDGKGEPGQVNAVSHGCAPARFRGVSIINTASKKGV